MFLERHAGAPRSSGDEIIGAHFRRLVRGTAVYGIGSILNRFLTFLLLPVFTGILTPADYGVVALIGVATFFLSGIFSLGTGSSLGICYYEREDERGRQHLVWTTALTVAINAGIWSAIGIGLAPTISDIALGGVEYAPMLRLALASLVVVSVTTPFLLYLRLIDQAPRYVFVTIVSTITIILLNVVFVVWMRRGAQGLFEANLIAQIVVLLTTLSVVAPSLGFGIDLNAVPALIKIGFPSIFGLGAFFVIDYVDRALLQRMVGIDEVGIYSVGYSFGLVMLVAVDAFAVAWPPYFVSFINRRAEAAALFGRILRYYLLIWGVFALLFFALARPVIVLMTAEAFHGAYTVVGLIALAYFLKGSYLILLPGIVFEKKLYLQSAIEWIAALLGLGVCLLLIPPLQRNGAAVATTAAYLALPLLTYALGKQYLRVDYDWGLIGRWIAGFVVAAALLSALNAVENVSIQVLAATFILCLFGAYVVRWAVTAQEREIVSELWRNRGSIGLQGFGSIFEADRFSDR